MSINLNHILDSVADGIAVFDRDLRCVFLNDAAERMMGVSRDAAVGRTPLEVFPSESGAAVIQRIHETLSSGQRLEYDTYHALSDRWFENRISPTAEGVTLLFTDITLRRKAEDALRQSGEGQRLLVSVNDAVRSIRAPEELMWAIVTRAGQHFRVSRCTYGEIDAAEEHILVARDYVDGIDSVAGRHRMAAFGPELVADLKAGRTVVVPDVDTDERTTGRPAYAAIQTRALICVPLVKDGRFVAVFVLQHRERRAWTSHDSTLAEQIAERTWIVVENARAESALRESRDVLSLAMRGGRMGAWSRNMLTNEVWWSRELEELFGLAPGGFEGSQLGFRLFVHEDDRDQLDELVATAIASRTDYVIEFRFKHADGGYRWMEGRARGVYGPDGEPSWLYGIGIDITERKVAEGAIRVLVQLDDAVRAMVDAEEIIQTAARLLGGHLDVDRCAYATVDADQDTFELSGDYGDPTDGTHSIVESGRFRQFGIECLRLMRAGEPYVVSDTHTDTRIDADDLVAYERAAIRAVICVPVMKSGQFVAAMAVQALEPRQWTPAEVELVQRVASRCWESLERARVQRERASLLDAAEAANRAKDEFLAMLGHELRNPLSPILTALQLMKLRGDESSLRERVVIERQVTHLTRLVDDLLDVARIARGKVELRTEIVDLAQIVAGAIEVASPLLEQRTQTLAIDARRAGLRVDGDPARLTQIVSNLLTNASKYTPPGGHIAVSVADEQGDAVIRVRDNGVGIAADVLPGLFDLFVQGGQAIDRAEGGLGLGLTIVRSLTERHGGSVSAHSEGPGKGSEFVVRLPLVQGHSTLPTTVAVGSVDDPAEETQSGIKVLIVDDNVDAAEMLAHALGLDGHHTSVAHDGPRALRLAATALPIVAFLDIGLPVMDGYELAARLREIPGLQGIRLVAVTGYGQESDRQRSAAAGFDHHLVKPVNLDDIRAVLERLVCERSA